MPPRMSTNIVGGPGGGKGMGPSGTASRTPCARSPLGRRAYASGGLREGPPNPYPCRPPTWVILRVDSFISAFKSSLM